MKNNKAITVVKQVINNHKNLILLIMIFQIAYSSKGQNLIPNPSFEDTSSCPNQLNQVYRATGWDSYGNSPDYYNSCFDINFPSVGGNQFANTGNGYIGDIFLEYSPQDRREFLGIKLSDTLEIGQVYYVSFYINCGGGEASQVACNKQGILFSTVPFDSTNLPPITNFSQVVNDSIITDSINWHQIHNSFVSDSAYSYLIIGNFYDHLLTDTIYLRDLSQVIFPVAYYFIDDICVSKDSNDCYHSVGIPNLPIANNIRIFPNPVSNDFNIENVNHLELRNIKIIDLLGHEIYYLESSGDQSINIDVEDINSGTYILKFEIGNDNYFYKLLVTHY